MQEIILPDDKPALEWVNNRVLQKVSPRRKHALAQVGFASALNAWAHQHGSGMVGTEWHFQVQPPGEISRTLVPDVAYLSYSSMSFDEQEATEIPRVAPDAVAEVRSPDDRQADIDEKIRVYLGAGTDVVFIVDPDQKIVVVRDKNGSRVVRGDDALEHDALPGFNLRVGSLFEAPRPK